MHAAYGTITLIIQLLSAEHHHIDDVLQRGVVLSE